ncbi:MAG: hypothetical protein Q4C82_06035 [Eubacteriales bacterium]|nr:hypothetical protein [Eubacteriales bacterium]
MNKKNEFLMRDDGPLSKAQLMYGSYDGLRENARNMKSISVQFNPSEYSVSRGLKFKNKTGHGEEADPKDLQAADSELANLRVSLVLDAATYMPEAREYLKDKQTLADVCSELALLMKIEGENHEQPYVCFSWGGMAFLGHMTSLNISYQMFDMDGNPVRVKLDVEIEGEDLRVSKEIRANPKESPDRTKYRRLNQREELWMLADAEYNDVSCWKEIARENGILNPRRVDHTRRLKVPAL